MVKKGEKVVLTYRYIATRVLKSYTDTSFIIEF